MFVEIQFIDSNTGHTLRREISNFNHNQQTAKESLKLFAGEEEKSGDEAQEFIYSRIPEELADFFFLDGEEIQKLVDDNKGREVKSEIEKVLKHTAILNSRDDLDTLLDTEYKRDLKNLEQEFEDRQQIIDEIQNLQNKKSDVRSGIGDLEEKKSNKEESLEKAREMLKKRNEEAMEQIQDLEGDIQDLSSDIMDRARDLRDSWEMLPIGILTEEINDKISDLSAEEERLESELEDTQRQEIIRELTSEAAQGECPICGCRDCNPEPIEVEDSENRNRSDEVQSRLVECRNRRDTLKDAPSFSLENVPSAIEEDLINLRSERQNLADDKEDLIGEYGGEITDSEKGELQESISDLEDAINRIESDIDEKEDKIERIEREIKSLQDDKSEMAGSSEIDRLEQKIEVTETVKKELKNVREAHIQEKRDKIRDEMSKVFDKVSQSEFIRERYDRIDFKGNPQDDDEYVLQLIEKDGTRKRMSDHPPSAGETQLAALSFIFGLNKYARYSTTIVFDTVAGRLDLENSRAQGEFFSSLDDPLILLVTDAEYQKLGEKMKQEVGTHHRIRPREDMSSKIVEVSD
jgi:DNA sulfur modification protein DndD